MPGTAAKLRALVEAGGDAVAGPFDGEEGITLMADLDAGATWTMPSALLPDLIEPVLAHYREGRRAEAAAAYARILPLINFENRQCGLRAAKAVMAEGGVIESEAVRHPLGPLAPATRAGLLELRLGAPDQFVGDLLVIAGFDDQNVRRSGHQPDSRFWIGRHSTTRNP